MEDIKFTFTDEEFLSVINQVCKKEIPVDKTFVPMTSMDEVLNVDRLDSLGMILLFVWLSELFEIPDDAVTVFVEKEVFTVQALKDFVMGNCTQTYSYADAEEFTRECL